MLTRTANPRVLAGTLAAALGCYLAVRLGRVAVWSLLASMGYGEGFLMSPMA